MVPPPEGFRARPLIVGELAEAQYASAVADVDRAPSSVAAVLAVARGGYDDLFAVAEAIEDEWPDSDALAATWRDRFDEVEASRGADSVAPIVVAAVETLVAETHRIDDPHRAIDWLSTFPQVLLLALGERP
jgi:hypothetical protein